MAKTRIVSFGYDHGDPPEADRVFDIRHTRYNKESWDREAERIHSETTPGERVAIGDKHGHTRSVQVAERVAKELEPDVSLKHRDQHKPHLLKGKTHGVVSENVRTLKHQGLSEADAVRVAGKKAKTPMQKETVKEVE